MKILKKLSGFLAGILGGIIIVFGFVPRTVSIIEILRARIAGTIPVMNERVIAKNNDRNNAPGSTTMSKMDCVISGFPISDNMPLLK